MRTLIGASALLVLSSYSVDAACTPQDLAGTWSLFGSNGGRWSQCDLRIAESGDLSGRCIGTGRKARGDRATGNIEIDDRCGFSGALKVRRFDQPLRGAVDEELVTGAGIVGFDDKEKNFGSLFLMMRRP